MIGALAGTVGITRLTCGVPVGVASDRWGRKRVLVGGALLFAVACLLFTVPSEPLLLIGPRILLGLAMLATFPLGVAYIADVVPEARRTLAISIYVSAQGAGYTVGPLLGSWLADVYGYHAAYDVAAGIAVATAALAAWRLRPSTAASRVVRSALPSRASLVRGLAAPAVANVFVMLMFSGAVLPFLALLGTAVGLSTFGVGALYAVRSVASVLARLPAGLLAGRLSNAQLMLGAVGLDAAGALCVGLARSAPCALRRRGRRRDRLRRLPHRRPEHGRRARLRRAARRRDRGLRDCGRGRRDGRSVLVRRRRPAPVTARGLLHRRRLAYAVHPRLLVVNLGATGSVQPLSRCAHCVFLHGMRTFPGGEG